MQTRFFITSLLLTLALVTSAQPVIYRCMSYEFKDEKDPSKDKVVTDVSFVSLDLTSEIDPCFKLTLNKEAGKVEDIVMKWNIKSNLGITPGTPKSITKTTYTVRREVLGVEEPEVLYLYITEDTAVKTLDVTIDNPQQKTSWIFYSLFRE